MEKEEYMKFFKEIGLAKGIKNLNKWIEDYKPILELIRLQAKKEVFDDLEEKYASILAIKSYNKLILNVKDL